MLSLTAGLGAQGNCSGPPRLIDPPSDMAAAFTVYNDMKNANLNIPESAYSALIRCSSNNNNPSQALELLREMQLFNIKPKLRTFSHLFETLSRNGLYEECFDLFEELTSKYELIPSENDYNNILKSCFHDKNKQKFYYILNSMMEDVLVLQSISSWEVFKEWFSNIEYNYNIYELIPDCHGKIIINDHEYYQLESVTLNECNREALLKQIDSIAHQRCNEIERSTQNLIENNNNNNNNGIINNETNNNNNNSNSNNNNNASFNESVISTIKPENDYVISSENTVKSENTSGLKRKHSHDGTPASLHNINSKTVLQSQVNSNNKHNNNILLWLQFKEWLNDISSKGLYDVVVDGANVGYYKQNFTGAPTHVEYAQIDEMLACLRERGFHPLLILHQRHLQPHSLPAYAKVIVDKWRSLELLYATPCGWNDDWFWMTATVTLRCSVVTNDEMRDHHFQMLCPR